MMSKLSLEKVFLKEYDALHSPEHEVLVEGRFLEITQSGQAIDQVWLGLTRTEFVISDLTYAGRKFLASKRSKESQIIKYSTLGAKGDDNYLKLRRTYPVKFIRILIIDDRARRMAVATSTSNITFYEMSKPKNQWERWKHAAVKLHQKQIRYRLRQEQIAKSSLSLGDELYSPESRYISYPLVCRRVTDKSIQTDPIPEVVSATSSPNKVDQEEPPAMDDLGHIVVQEYEVVFERVAFHNEDDMITLSEIKRSHNIGRSRSNTCVLDNDLLTQNPVKSTSCPSLWKAVDTVTHGTSMKSREKHFARRKLNSEEINKIEEMIQYRNSQIKDIPVYGQWNTSFTWNWADCGNLSDIELERLMDEAKPGLGMPSNASKCTSCGHSGQTTREGSTVGAFDLIEYISTAEVREYHAGEIAMQLTLRDRNLLWHLSQTDITKLALSKRPRSFQDIESLAIVKMCAWSERVGRLVATEILDQPNYDSCLETTKLFIKVAEFCWMIRNLNSFANIMRGLRFYSVYRLGLVWEYIHKTEPEIGELYLTMCDQMPKLYDLSVSMTQLPPGVAYIPWFPTVVCELINETLHLQYNYRFLTDKSDDMVDLNDLEVCLVRHVGSQTVVPKSVLNFAENFSSSIIEEAMNEASWQVFDSGSSECEEPDEGVNKVDSRAFDYLHKGEKVVDDSVVGLARRGVLTLLGENSSDDEFAPADNAPVDHTVRGRFVRFVKGKPPGADSDVEHSEKTLFTTAKEGIAKVIPASIKTAPTKIAHTTPFMAAHESIARVIPLPKRFQPEPPVEEDRELTLLERLSGKTKPEPKRRKSVLESARYMFTGEEEDSEEDKPYIRKVVDKDLKKLVKSVKIDEANEPKDTVHVVANKTRTPKVMRFFGRIFRMKKKSTNSMGGTPYVPSEADLALLTFPTNDAQERSTHRYSENDKNRKVRAALNIQDHGKDMVRRKSLLASSEAFSQVNNRFKNLNTNVNAIETPRRHYKSNKNRSSHDCELCLSSNCRYKGEPAKCLIEAQLAASKYTYFHDKVADRFLTRRPVLSDYALLKSFQRPAS